MILKSYEIKKIQQSILEKKIFLFYGENYGLKKEIEEIVKSTINKNGVEAEKLSLFESDVIKNQENFYNSIFSGSLFANKKIICIYYVSDKIIKNIEEITDKIPEGIFLLFFSDKLEKKSKLRNFFEKNINTVCTPCYFDDEKNLEIIAKDELFQEKIMLSKESLNLIVRKSNGDRGNLRNELDKIKNYAANNKKIDYEKVKYLVNSSGEIKFENLINSCLCGEMLELKKNLVDFSVESVNQILLLKILSNKIRRLILIKKEKQAVDQAINNIKPPIFWKEKPLVRKQLGIWSTSKLIKTIQEINDIEILCKKNHAVASIIFFNFFTSICKKANYQT